MKIAPDEVSRHMRSALPEAADVPDESIRAALAELARVKELEIASRRRLKGLEAERPAAVAADRAALAASMRSKSKDPGSAALTQLDLDTEAARRSLEAATLALEACFRDLADVVDRQRDALRAALSKGTTAARSALLKSLSKLEADRGKLADLEALERWADRFPRGYAQGVPAVPLEGGKVGFGSIVEALRAEATGDAVGPVPSERVVVEGEDVG
jgi:hypothetical protein